MTSLKLEDDQIDEVWVSLTKTVDEILAGEKLSKNKWQLMFVYIYQIRMMDAEDGKFLLTKYLVEKITEYALKLEKQILPKSHGPAFLESYLKKFAIFESTLRYLNNLFIHLDMHCFDNSSPAMRAPLRQTLSDVWLNEVYRPKAPDIVDCILRLIGDYRSGLIVNKDLIAEMKKSLMYLEGNTYELASQYVSKMRNYYAADTAEYIHKHGVRNYIPHAVKLLAGEEHNTSLCLDPDVLPDVMQSVVNELVEKHQEKLFSEMTILLSESDEENLKHLYWLMGRTGDGVKQMLPVFEKHLQELGMGMLYQDAKSTIKDPIKFVTVLNSIYEEFTSVIGKCFADDVLFLASRDKVFQTIVNDTDLFTQNMPESKERAERCAAFRIPELLAVYLDKYLRKKGTGRRMNEEEIKTSIEKCLIILNYIKSGDVFMRFCKANLGRRILSNTLWDMEMEESVVDQLTKVGMPADHVRQLKQMLVDTKLSTDLNKQFKGSFREKSIPNTDTFTMMVLNSGAWVLSSDMEQNIAIPPECEDALAVLKSFYLDNHAGHTLTWQNHLSRAVVTYTSDRGAFDLEVTVHQLVVLNEWNRNPNEMLQMEHLKVATLLSDQDLRNSLWDLSANPKLKPNVLICIPEVSKATDFIPTTKFGLNLDFHAKKKNISLIGRLSLTQGVDMDDYVTKGIHYLRKVRTDEAIMKVLKTQNEMHLDSIYVEVVTILRHHFQPKKQFIKDRLEDMIKENIIIRSDTDSDKYIYNA